MLGQRSEPLEERKRTRPVNIVADRWEVGSMRVSPVALSEDACVLGGPR